MSTVSTVLNRAEQGVTRQLAALSDDGISGSLTGDHESILDSDSGETTDLLLERLSAWKHVCQYLWAYISATAKAQRSQSGEYEAILKSVTHPLNEGHHFKQSADGVGGLFENIYKNTMGMVKVYTEAERNLTEFVLPTLERLIKEVKTKSKELKADKSKRPKVIRKAWRATQKQISLLAQSTELYDATIANKIEPGRDPYLLRRSIDHRLKIQKMKEMADRQGNLDIQESFLWFEMHLLQAVQCALATFFQHMDGLLDNQRTMYGDILGTAQLILPDLEWSGFVERKNAIPLDRQSRQRLSAHTTFPNKDHQATKPIIEGDLECHSSGITRDDHTGYYVVTRAGYLHGFSHNDDPYNEPVPDMSLYLADCLVSPLDGANFSVKGVDVSSRKIVTAFHVTTEFNFRAQNTSDAQRWHSVIEAAAKAQHRL